MADWTIIADAALDPDAPLTSELAYAWRDNPIAITEGATDAPYVQSGWHPYDSLAVGDGNDGLIYDFAVDGAKASVETPDFVDGYEYAVVLRDVGFNLVSDNPIFVVGFYKQTDAAYQYFNFANSSSTASSIVGAEIVIHRPRDVKTVHTLSTGYWFGSRGGPLGQDGGIYDTPAQKVLRARVAPAATSGGFLAGKIFLYRRRVF